MENRRMVVDTSIFIDYLRANNKAETSLRKLPNDAKVYVSPVMLYELYMGATNTQKWKDVKILTEDIPIIPFSKEVAEKSALLYQALKKKNQVIEFRDIFIAATALIYNLPVLTRNSKHFSRIKNLKVIAT